MEIIFALMGALVVFIVAVFIYLIKKIVKKMQDS